MANESNGNTMTLDDVTLELMLANENLAIQNKNIIDQTQSLTHQGQGIHTIVDRLTNLLDYFNGKSGREEETRLDTAAVQDETLETLHDIDSSINNLDIGTDAVAKPEGGFWGTLKSLFAETGIMLAAAVAGLLTGIVVGFFQTAILDNLAKIRIPKFVTRIGTWISGIFRDVKAFFSGIGTQIADKFRAIKDSIKNSKFSTSVKDFFTGVGDKFRAIKDSIKNSKSMTSVKDFFTGVGDKFRAIKDSIKNSKFTTSVKDIFTGIGDKFKRVKELFNFKGFGMPKNILGNLNPFKKIMDTFKDIGPKFMKFFGIGKTIGRVLGKLALPLTILMSIYDGIMGAIDGYKTGGIAGAIKGAVLGVFNGLAGWVWDGIMWIFKSIYRYFGDDAAADALEAWDFMSTITWLWDSIQGFIEAIITPFVWMFNKIGEYLDDPMKIFSDIWEGIKAIPGLIWSGIKGLWGLFKGIGKTILAWFLPDRFSWLGKIVAKTGIYEKLGISGQGGSEKEKLTDETANNIVAERKAKNEALRARGLKPDGVTPIGVTNPKEILPATKPDSIMTPDGTIVPITNSTGAQIDGISKENSTLSTQAPVVIAMGSGDSAKNTSATTNVSNVTYQSNNIPDRSYAWSAGMVGAF